MKTHTVATAVTTAALTFAFVLPAFGDDYFQNGVDLAPSALALSSVPRDYLTWYQQAAHTCRGLAWPVLAGIGEMESGHGQSNAPGVHSSSNFAGAQGPMQFEPSTFAAYAVRADTRHPLSVYNPEDAIYSAAKMLCANGAASGTPGGLQSALLAYNNVGWYPPAVLNWAARYGRVVPASASSSSASVHKLPVTSIASGPLHTGTISISPSAPARPVAVTPVKPVAPLAKPKPAVTGPVTKPAATATIAQPAHVDPFKAPGNVAAEERHLSAQAQQLAAEAARLSALAKQLSAEARQLSASHPAAKAPASALAASASSAGRSSAAGTVSSSALVTQPPAAAQAALSPSPSASPSPG